MFYYFYAFIYIFLLNKVNTTDLEYEIIKTKNSSDLKFVPLSIIIDYQVLDNKYPQINKTEIEILKRNLNKAKLIYESLLSVNYQYHIITPKYNLGDICKNNILDNIGAFGFYTNIIIFPLLGNNTTYSDYLTDYFLCIYGKVDTRPMLATITLSQKLLFFTEEEILLEILHSFFHILGFRQNAREKAGMKKMCKGNLFENIELKKVAKKYMGIYSSKISLFNNLTRYLHWTDTIDGDIMSYKTNRSLNFKEYSLRYLQNLKFYRVNMNICGCSLRGECSYGALPYEIHINPKTLQFYCYRNEVFKEQCIINNNIYYFNLKKYNDINYQSKKSYFINDKSRNYDIIYDYNIDLLYKGLIDQKEFSKQTLFLVSPIINNYCKCHLKTVYLYNKFDPEYNKYVKKNYKIEKIEINDLNKIVYASFTIFNSKHSDSFRETFEYNNIYLINSEYSPNFLFSIMPKSLSSELLSHQTQYTLFRNTQYLSNLGDKNVTYRLYYEFHKKFPNDFNYMPESYIMPIQKNIVEEKFKNYTEKEDDLWLCKPSDGSLGEGIYFLHNYTEFLNCSEIISKYIHNPHLCNKRKYHIRLYNFVSSIKPLIIYAFKEGQVMRASHEYKKNLEDVSDKQSFLTNAHINLGKDGYIEDLSLEQLKAQIIKDGGNWDDIWEQIKDICVKIIITSYDKEYSRHSSFSYYNEKTFFYLGLDMMIDENFRVWFLEGNDCAHMEGYDKVNKKNKFGVSTDIINILGLIPFDHSNGNPIEENKCHFNNKIEEKINNAFCEFNRPNGNFERIFPVKETLSYYKKFFVKDYKENLELWKYF